jgi:hypothetical protein
MSTKWTADACDGIAEWFFALEKANNDARAGWAWTPYMQQGSELRMAAEGVSFDPDRLYVGWIPEIQDYGLVSYSSSSTGGEGPGQGIVHVIRKRGDTISSEILRRIRFDRADDVELFERLFPDVPDAPGRRDVRLEILDVDELRAAGIGSPTRRRPILWGRSYPDRGRGAVPADRASVQDSWKKSRWI